MILRISTSPPIRALGTVTFAEIKARHPALVAPRLPQVPGRLSKSGESFTVRCPFCCREHTHGLPGGVLPESGSTTRSTHCHPGGEYNVRLG